MGSLVLPSLFQGANDNNNVIDFKFANCAYVYKENLYHNCASSAIPNIESPSLHPILSAIYKFVNVELAID